MADKKQSTPVRQVEAAAARASSVDEARALRNLAKDLEKSIGEAYAKAGIPISTKK